MNATVNRSTAIGSLTLGLVLTVVIVIVLFNIFFYFISTQQFETDLRERAQNSALQLSAVLGSALWNFDEQSIEQSAAVYAGLEDVVNLRITATEGDVFFDYSSAGESAVSVIEEIFFEENLVGQVRIAFSSFGLQIAQRDRLVSTLLSTLLVVVAIVVASRLLLRRFIERPLTEMVNGLTIIGRGDYNHRLPLFQKRDIDAIITNINDMAAQIADRDQRLRQSVDTLEDRVSERTRDLTIAQDISREITTQFDQRKLLEDVVNITQVAFDLYQVNVYLLETAENRLTLAAASGESGQTMLAAGRFHNLDGKGLVPTAAVRKAPAVSNDVTNSADHLVNPLLPETRAEAALPIIFAGTLVGVLDLQAAEVNRFDDQAINLYTSFANQLAIALRNAALFTEAAESRGRAEESDRVKSAFLASMSHELRTPLNAIINFSKFLRREIPGTLNEEQQKLVGNIVDSGQHLLNLINDVLDMSKIESGALKLFVEPNADVGEIVQNAINVAQPTLADKPVQLVRTLPQSLPRIACDRRRVLQVLINVLSNACKFTESGKIEVGAQVKADSVVISVSDSGPGIAREDADYVFMAFKQTETGLRQGGGTGLGMPISKRLIEAHQGRLWFDSEPGVGTTFYVELPFGASESMKVA